MGSQESTETVDVVIVGAGVTGTACAHGLAADHDVLVLDKGQVGSGATSRASGLISTSASYPEVPEAGEVAMEFFRSLDGTGIFDFTQRPKLHLVPEAGVENARTYATNSSSAAFLDRDEVDEQYPDAVDMVDYGGALEYTDTGTINALDYTLTLKREAERNGAEFRTDTQVNSIIVGDGSTTDVTTEYGTIRAPNVVVAAGWRTRELLESIVTVPTRPIRWEAVEFAPDDGLPESFPMGSDPLSETYWRSIHGDNVLVGGNPTTVERPQQTKYGVSAGFLSHVRERIPVLLPVLENAAVVKGECCPTPDAATPDAMPIIDAPDDAADGIVIATGFQRGGVLTSPCTRVMVRALVTGESSPVPLEPFALRRFDSRTSDFELPSIYNTFE